MKFTFKVFICTIVVIAAALGFGGIYLVNSLFGLAIDRETRQAMDENNLLRFAFETIVLNVPLKYGVLQDKTIEEIALTLKTGRYIRITGEDKQALYSFEGIDVDSALLDVVTDTTQACRVIQSDERYFVHTATSVEVRGRLLYMETFKDISYVFEDRRTGFMIYRNITLLMLFGGAIIISVISLWLTRPMRLLSAATKGMAAGDYAIRARRISNDELGLLTDDFNSMADALGSTISELKEAAESRERFVAAFAHELKTPLTAIVGYADLLRSRKLDEENSFLSANYIYTEGKRLENLSLRLLDIFVLKNRTLKMRKTPVSNIFALLEATFRPERDIALSIAYDQSEITAEADLLAAALINIADNAVKASDEGGKIEVTGRAVEQGYQFCVRDYGLGIAPDQIEKITQAFYMVDKSRSRSRQGAGLGLTLCAEILALHSSVLAISSKTGEGTEVSFLIKEHMDTTPV